MNRRYAAAVALLAGVALALVRPVPARAASPGRDVAVILDTSGSMRDNDRARYTVQLTQILADLLETGDQLSVTLMPKAESCSDGPDPALSIRFDAADRAAFKRQLDSRIVYGGGTYFAKAVRTAIGALPTTNPTRPRLLLIIADSGGFGGCERELTAALRRLRESGATVAAINLGLSAGAFDRNPAFTFTTAAKDAEELVKAVAEVYQRFLGGRKVQTGRVSGDVQVTVDSHVREAFLVVAADGPISAVSQAPGGPGAKSVDTNFRGGGQTRGLDHQTRSYRIVRLERPESGRWTFTLPGLSQTAGWLLLQDHAIAVRLVSSPTVGAGAPSPVELEVYDELTGQAITDPATLKGLDASVEIDGTKVPLRDDGADGDRRANDGVLTGTVTLPDPGRKPLDVRLRTDVIDRAFRFDLQAVETAWRIEPLSPARVDAGVATRLAVRLHPSGSGPVAGKLPERLEARIDGRETVILNDSGKDSDEQAGDGVYSGTWTSVAVGRHAVVYDAVGGAKTSPVTAPIEVIGRVELGPVNPLGFGTLRRQTEASAALDLSSAKVFGRAELHVTSSMKLSGVALEINVGGAWKALDAQPLALALDLRGERRWTVRARAGTCPGANHASRLHTLTLVTGSTNGKPQRVDVPVSLEVVPDSWLRCWWPLLAALAAALVTAVIVHGYWSPSRFSPRAVVQISQEENMEEGFPHAIRATRGTGSGFYRDAVVYVCADYCLRGRPLNALARLRASGNQVRIRPVAGATVRRRTLDGEWEPLGPEESVIRTTVPYRDEGKNLFFEVRIR